MSKKLVLINPKFTVELAELNISMSLMWLGSYLSYKGYEVNIMDANNFASMGKFYERLKQNLSDALAVGLSIMTAQIPSAIQISKCVRGFAPGIPIIWGGVHPTFYPEQTAKADYVDFAVKGEGEVTALELLTAIEGNDSAEEIKGIAFKSKNEGRVIVTGERELLDINTLPPIEWQLLEDIRSVSDMGKVARLTYGGIPLVTSRGCPHRCTFCINSLLKLKPKYRYKRTELVLEDIERLIDLGVDYISFYDEDLFANKRRFIEIVEGIEERGLKFEWFASVRADYFRAHYLNPDLLLKMKTNGCSVLGIGAESGSPKILNKLKKDITIEQTLNAARLLSDTGINANFSFMIGLPGEGEDDVKQTLQLISKIAKIDIRLRIIGPQIYRPYPGSVLYLECLGLGMKEPNTLDEWADSPYVQSEIEIKSEHRHFFPWIKYPVSMKDLTRLVFYSNVLGFRFRPLLINKLVRKMALIRCRKFYFKYPVEMKIYKALGRIGFYKLVKIRRLG